MLKILISSTRGGGACRGKAEGGKIMPKTCNPKKKNTNKYINKSVINKEQKLSISLATQKIV